MPDDIVIRDELEIKERTYFSISHVVSAAHFARQAAAIEREHSPEEWPSVHSVHQAYVVGAILSVVSFLEATINEWFADAADGLPYEHLKGVHEDVISRMARMWVLGVPRTASYSILKKYNIALGLAGIGEIDNKLRPGSGCAVSNSP